MSRHVILWRRLDLPGIEACMMERGARGLELTGAATFAFRRRPCVLSYSVSCSPDGSTRSAKVEGMAGSRAVSIRIEADRARRWKLNGRRCVAVDGCDDVDLNFSPSTNTLSIRRLSLAVGGEARVRSAWLRFPDFSLHPLEQVYRRLSRERYAYRSTTGFSATLEVNRSGLITRYGRVWKAAAGS